MTKTLTTAQIRDRIQNAANTQTKTRIAALDRIGNGKEFVPWPSVHILGNGAAALFVLSCGDKSALVVKQDADGTLHRVAGTAKASARDHRNIKASISASEPVDPGQLDDLIAQALRQCGLLHGGPSADTVRLLEVLRQKAGWKG